MLMVVAGLPYLSQLEVLSVLVSLPTQPCSTENPLIDLVLSKFPKKNWQSTSRWYGTPPNNWAVLSSARILVSLATFLILSNKMLTSSSINVVTMTCIFTFFLVFYPSIEVDSFLIPVGTWSICVTLEYHSSSYECGGSSPSAWTSCALWLWLLSYWFHNNTSWHRSCYGTFVESCLTMSAIFHPCGYSWRMASMSASDNL